MFRTVKSISNNVLEVEVYYSSFNLLYLPKGVGSIFTFHVKGGEAEARKVIDHLEIFSDLANVADAKSLVVHPATTTYGQLSEKDLEAAGVTPNQLRLSIGLENVEDLIEDLRLALEKI